MQAGDRHEVGHTRAAEQAPVFIVDRPLVADRERDQHARSSRFPQHAEKTRANAFPHSLDVIAGQVALADFLLLATLANIAGCPEAALHEPGFVVETLRVDASMRALEAHGKEPSFA